MKRVTVICETLARERLTSLLAEEGARGHTAYPVTGVGAKGAREGDIADSGNIQIDVIVPDAVATRLLERLARDILPHFATVVYESDVRVLRQEKF
jgi:nitrogen regulatory protein PII